MNLPFQLSKKYPVEYCSAGPAISIQAFFPDVTLEDPILLPIYRQNKLLGQLSVRLVEPYLVIDLEPEDDLTANEAVEAYRICGRILSKMDRYAHDILVGEGNGTSYDLSSLALDGFVPTIRVREDLPGKGYLYDISGKFRVNNDNKVDSMAALYIDPFSVPWNFVPVETDLLQYLLMDRSGTTTPRVLDLGCGFGKNARFLERNSFEVYGLDIAPGAIARCQELVEHPDRFLAGDAARLPWPPAFFDYVLDVGCLHCIGRQGLDSVLEQIHAVLKPGGILFARIFKPRSREWLDNQPFHTEEMGMTFTDFHDSFSSRFDLTVLEETDNHYLKAVKRA